MACILWRFNNWAGVVLTLARTSQSLGLPAPAAADLVNMDPRDRSRPPDELQFFYDVTQTQGRAMAAFMRQASCSAGAVTTPGNVNNTLHVLIKSYNAELNSFAPRLSGERSRLPSLGGGQGSGIATMLT